MPAAVNYMHNSMYPLQLHAPLSEGKGTPREAFIRKMMSLGRVPVPILLRHPSALDELNLAHRGLGDDTLCAAAEVGMRSRLRANIDHYEIALSGAYKY